MRARNRGCVAALFVASACTSAERAAVQRTPCEQMCEVAATCGTLAAGRDAPTCARECENDARRPIDACAAGIDAYARCFARLECDVARATWTDPGASTSACAAEFATLSSCDPSNPPEPVPKIYFQF